VGQGGLIVEVGVPGIAQVVQQRLRSPVHGGQSGMSRVEVILLQAQFRIFIGRRVDHHGKAPP
jgi:hypothetical protein